MPPNLCIVRPLYDLAPSPLARKKVERVLPQLPGGPYTYAFVAAKVGVALQEVDNCDADGCYLHHLGPEGHCVGVKVSQGRATTFASTNSRAWEGAHDVAFLVVWPEEGSCDAGHAQTLPRRRKRHELVAGADGDKGGDVGHEDDCGPDAAGASTTNGAKLCPVEDFFPLDDFVDSLRQERWEFLQEVRRASNLKSAPFALPAPLIGA